MGAAGAGGVLPFRFAGKPVVLARFLRQPFKVGLDIGPGDAYDRMPIVLRKAWVLPTRFWDQLISAAVATLVSASNGRPAIRVPTARIVGRDILAFLDEGGEFASRQLVTAKGI